MATLLDFGSLKPFQQLFPFLLVLVFTWAVLMRTKTFEDKPAFIAIASFALAVLATMFPLVRETLNLAAPWFVLVFVVFVFILIAYQMFGIQESTILQVITGKEHGSAFAYWIIALALIIAIGSFSFVISKEQGFTQLTKGGNITELTKGADEKARFFQSITNPKIVGMAVIFLIGLFTIQNLGAKPD